VGAGNGSIPDLRVVVDCGARIGSPGLDRR
jgi:hypothetical protein